MRRRTAPRRGRPTRTQIVPLLEDAHARATRLAEAFDVGDFELVALGLPDLAHDLWRAVEFARHGRIVPRCGFCGLMFDWPGQLEQHVRLIHPEAA